MLKKNIKKFRPSLEPILAFHYKQIEEHHNLEEQIQFLESLRCISLVYLRKTIKKNQSLIMRNCFMMLY
jgi:hypothetical protein